MMQSSSSTELVVRISRIAFNLSSDKQNKLMAMVSISGLFLSSFSQLSSHRQRHTKGCHIYILFIKNSWFDLFYDICHYSGNQSLVNIKSKFDQTELCAKKVCFYTKTTFR
jgi:hypothetical protein